jgi:hypothetical protein
VPLLPVSTPLLEVSPIEVAFFRLKVSCYYVANITRTLAFLTRPRDNEPFAETGTGRLMVRMRLAQGKRAQI